MPETSNQSICVGCKFARWDSDLRDLPLSPWGDCRWGDPFGKKPAVWKLRLDLIDKREIISCPVREDADPGKGDV